jgi:hypothetical protein
MERAEARRLQPHFVAQFFFAAFKEFGGSIFEREPGRYEITRVPAAIRQRDRQISTREPLLERYERVTFDKHLVSVPGKPVAAYLVPGHPLINALTDLVLERYRRLLTQGAVLIDEGGLGTLPRALFYLEDSITDARTGRHGQPTVVSRQLQFVEIDAEGNTASAGYAPYLDYRPLAAEERPYIETMLATLPLTKPEVEAEALKHAVVELMPRHFEEVKARKEALVAKTRAAVKDRLTKEIIYWDHRAAQLRQQLEAGKQSRINPQRAQRRADELQARLERRWRELDEEAQLSQRPPVIVGSALIVPAGLLRHLANGAPKAEPPKDTAQVERLAMEAVMKLERALGFKPRDVSAEKVGYDIESRDPQGGPLRFIEVKGRVRGADTVTVTKNEILTALNKPEQFILAIVLVDGGATTIYYRLEPFAKEPDFDEVSSNYDLHGLLTHAERMEA